MHHSGARNDSISRQLEISVDTVCPRSRVHICVVSRCMKLDLLKIMVELDTYELSGPEKNNPETGYPV